MRREGSYIYEEFMPTGGTDVKVRKLLQVFCSFSWASVLFQLLYTEK